MFDTAAIPGMIEPVEQKLLADLAASERAGGAGLIVEFGCFFGRSTACLLNGAERFGSQDGPRVLAFDSFVCADGQGFAPHVWAFAKSGGVENLVRRQQGRLDFYPVYQHFVGRAEEAGLLKTVVGELSDATFDGRPIGLMHVDAPKFYEELKYVLFNFFPYLAPGGAVVFQDFFYHWSATMTAAAQLLAERGYIRFDSSAASSAVATVLRPPTVKDLLDFDLAFSREKVPALLDRSIEAMSHLPIDRPDQFVPRIHLAKVQYLWEQGDPGAAQQAFAGMIRRDGNKLTAPVFADFMEMMRYGFSLRKLYELDHA